MKNHSHNPIGDQATFAAPPDPPTTPVPPVTEPPPDPSPVHEPGPERPVPKPVPGTPSITPVEVPAHPGQPLQPGTQHPADPDPQQPSAQEALNRSMTSTAMLHSNRTSGQPTRGESAPSLDQATSRIFTGTLCMIVVSTMIWVFSSRTNYDTYQSNDRQANVAGQMLPASKP